MGMVVDLTMDQGSIDSVAETGADPAIMGAG